MSERLIEFDISEIKINDSWDGHSYSVDTIEIKESVILRKANEIRGKKDCKWCGQPLDAMPCGIDHAVKKAENKQSDPVSELEKLKIDDIKWNHIGLIDGAGEIRNNLNSIIDYLIREKKEKEGKV